MNLLNTILPADLSGAIFWTLFHSLWISFLVCAAIYYTYQSVSRQNPGQRYNIALAGYGLILLFTGVMFLLEYKGISPMNYSSHLESNYVIIPLEGAQQSAASEESNLVLEIVYWIGGHSGLIVQLWLVGLLLLSIKYLMGFNSIRIVKSHSHPPGLMLLQATKQLAFKLRIKRSFRLRESDLFTSPFTVGWLKPIILLPLSLTTGMPQSQIEAIIAHELAHLKRNDYIINLTQTFFDIIFYFNPFIRWLSNLIRAEREKCCDKMAAELTGDKVSLANALASAQEAALQPEPALSLWGDGKQLLERIKLLIDDSDETNFSNRSGAVVLLTIIVSSISFFAFTNVGIKSLNPADFGSGNSALDLLQLDNSVNEITDLLNGIVDTKPNSGIENNNTAKENDSESNRYNISERYSESLQSLGVNPSDLSRQMEMYNEYMKGHKIENDKLMLDLNNLQNLDIDFDLNQFKLEMDRMNTTMKELRKQIRGGSQANQKK